MKKTLLLSVVASTMIMAGGDIAPVEPVVEAPVVVASGWDFDGQAAFYYETNDNFGNGSLFDQGPATATEGSSVAAVGLQLRAANKDLFAGIGAGFELTGLGTLGLQSSIVSNVTQSADGSLNGGAWTQGYLTYGFGNTSIKVGRQALPKGLSPFAFSETWSVFKNTFEAALVVNTDLPDTALVYAFVNRGAAIGNLGNFTDLSSLGATINADDGVHMLTAQNKSISGLTLTGTWYYAADALQTAPKEDVNILWGDAKFAISDYSIGLQGGTILTNEPGAVKDTTAFGAKIGADFGMFDASVAYSSVDDGTAPVENLGTNVKTPLYTQMIKNQNHIKSDNDTIVIRAGVKALGGKFSVAYDITTDNATANSDYTELDVVYKTKVSESTTLLAAYILAEDDLAPDATNYLRFWARYNF